GEVVFEVGPVGGVRQQLTQAVDVAIELRILVGAAELGQHLRMALAADADLIGLRHHAGEAGFAGRRIGGAAGHARQEGHQQQRYPEGDGGAAAAHCRTSICSGWVMSISGPLKYRSQPRARRRAPSSDLKSTPLSRSSRSDSSSKLSVKSVL